MPLTHLSSGRFDAVTVLGDPGNGFDRSGGSDTSSAAKRMIAGMDAFEWMALQGYSIEDDDTGATGAFGSGEVVFAGLTSEDLDALTPDLIIS